MSLPPKLSFSSTIYHLSPPLKYWFYTTHQQICLNFCLCNVFAPDIALNFRWEKRQQLSALNPNLHFYLFISRNWHLLNIWTELRKVVQHSSADIFRQKRYPHPHPNPTLGGKFFCLKKLKKDLTLELEYWIRHRVFSFTQKFCWGFLTNLGFRES